MEYTAVPNRGGYGLKSQVNDNDKKMGFSKHYRVFPSPSVYLPGLKSQLK